jgi:hypothetical protein
MLNIHNVNSIDLWLGGAYLTADNLWRWDDKVECNRPLGFCA